MYHINKEKELNFGNEERKQNFQYPFQTSYIINTESKQTLQMIFILIF